MNALLDQAKANTEELPEDKGGFDAFLHPEGPTFARFVGYCEVGVRHQKPWQGKAKKDAPEARFTFELNGPKSMRTITPEGEEPFTVPTLIRVKIAKKGGDKSSYVKLLRKMAYGRDITNFAIMLNEGFLIRIVHGHGEDRDGNKKTYHNMRDADGTFTIGAPMMEDPLSGTTTEFNIPEAVTPLSYFSWDNPTKEQWASIFIDGERTVKDADGNESTESKNWLQRDIVIEALNFQGSPLEAMLNGMSDLTMPSEDPSKVVDQSIAEAKAEAEAEAEANKPVVDRVAEASLAADAAALALLSKVKPTAAQAVGLKGPIQGQTATVTMTDDKPAEVPESAEPTADVDEAAKALAAAKAVFDQLSAGK